MLLIALSTTMLHQTPAPADAAFDHATPLRRSLPPSVDLEDEATIGPGPFRGLCGEEVVLLDWTPNGLSGMTSGGLQQLISIERSDILVLDVDEDGDAETYAIVGCPRYQELVHVSLTDVHHIASASSIEVLGTADGVIAITASIGERETVRGFAATSESWVEAQLDCDLRAFAVSATPALRVLVGGGVAHLTGDWSQLDSGEQNTAVFERDLIRDDRAMDELDRFVHLRLGATTPDAALRRRALDTEWRIEDALVGVGARPDGGLRFGLAAFTDGAVELLEYSAPAGTPTASVMQALEDLMGFRAC
jgi:hypothetical protein